MRTRVSHCLDRPSLGLLLSLGSLAIAACAYPFNVKQATNPVCWVGSVCIPYQSKEYTIRQRSFVYPRTSVPQTLWADYCEEYEYISTRRARTRGQASTESEGDRSECRNKTSGAQPPEELSGLAFSGGGIRSATFHLGVLQALQQIHITSNGSGEGVTLLEGLDYLSTVSGGSYIAGWMLSHLFEEQTQDRAPAGQKAEERADAQPEGGQVDAYGFLVQTQDPDRLLDPSRNLMLHLRDRAGFVKGGGFCEICSLLGAYVWRLPFYLVWDLGLHAKTVFTPDIGNGVHLFNPTRDRIEGTYFRGRNRTALSEINGKEGTLAPYLIVNANLVNKGRLLGAGGRYVGERDNYSFEFTRDFSGTDALGYVQTHGFGRPVLDVTWSKVDGLEPIPVRVRVEEPQDEKARKASAFLLSEAVTTSAAAFDLESTLTALARDATSQTVLRYALAPLNLNFEFQTWNYARPYNGLWSVWDYIRMVTYQRLFWPHTDARWIEITDGAFYDNLGVMTLLRRGVSHVLVGDATLDPKWEHHYLEKLQAEANYYGLEWCSRLPEQGDRDHAYRRFWVRRPDQSFAVIHYLKPYAYNPDLEEGKPHQPRLDPCADDSPAPQEAKAARRHLHIEQIPILSANAVRGTALTPDELKDLVKIYCNNRRPGKGRNQTRESIKKLLEVDRLTLEQERRMQDEYFTNHMSVERVKLFATSDLRNGFPHTSTSFQWYEPEEFEAYRSLGYLMAKAYLSDLVFDQAARTPKQRDKLLDKCQPASVGQSGMEQAG